MQQSFNLFISAIILVCLLAIDAMAKDAPAWKPLFNGMNLDGFDVVVKDNATGIFFTVEDGVIKTYPEWQEGKEAPNGMLVTEKAYSRFHLRWQYRYDGRQFRKGRNSGVLYHVQDDDVWPVCVEYQLQEGHGGWPVLIKTRAALKLTDGRYDPDGEESEVGEPGKITLREGAVSADKEVGEWNTAELLVQGDYAVHVLNGEVIARIEKLQKSNPADDDWSILNRGRLAFQCEGAGIEFRNIEIMENPVGYIDTPLIPGQPWRVHDNARPQPPRAILAETDQLPVPPPAGAVVLLDKQTYQFTNDEWQLQDGILTVARKGDKPKAQNSKIALGDGHYHVEWSAPTEITGESQGRGNSGVFIMGRYEVQVLDCWDNYTYPDGMTGALYGQLPPLFNAVRQPGKWNYYDIFFKAPVFDGEQLVRPACITVMLNGVVIQNNEQLLGETVHRAIPQYRFHEDKWPLSLQDHGNPVRYRNIWVVPLDRNTQNR